MKTKWIFAAILIVFIAGVLLSVLAINTKDVVEVDIVAINEVIKTLEHEWELIEQGKYRHLFPQDITIIDHGGNILYQTNSRLSGELNDALRNREIIVDIMQNDGIAGKVIIHDQDQAIVQQMKMQLVRIVIVIFAVLALLCIFYIVYINQTVFKPFKKLQSFAVHVARGNLDIPLNIDKNNPFGAFTESFDIMREELAAARQSEYASNRSKKELVATLSHDIKTPVASIKAVSELMLMRATDEKTIKQLGTIYAKAEQINLLVTDMFHATLEELQQLKVVVTEESSTALMEMIANVNDDHQISCEPLPDCILLTDLNRLQQVLDNVLSNSYKYAGTPITIAAQLSTTHLELSIMDYGKGVSEEELPLLFNKFYRGKQAEGRSGSGLGLYISKYFMQNMQGDMLCHNREDGFTVTLSIKLA